MKYATGVLACLLSFSCVHSMQLEMVPFLNKEEPLINQKKENVADSCVIEQLYLVRRIPSLRPWSKSKPIRNKIIEYMVKLDREKRDQEIVLELIRKFQPF